MALAVHRPIIVLSQLLIIFVFINLESSAMSAPQVPCFFIFGDSLVDNGNNNELKTSAKVNYPPYGNDFPQGPTGRFTNGRNIADFLAQFLGFDTYIPPFAMAQGKEIINGVNYASGSSGIRGETGKQLGDNISLERQLLNHNLTLSRISHFLGNHTSNKNILLRKCLYYFVFGSNDYINNYFVPQYYTTSSRYKPEKYATILVQQYSLQLKKLYELGGRKVCVSGLGSLGCIPSELGRGTKGSPCVDSINHAVRLFNEKLRLLVSDLNHNLTDAEFIYISTGDLKPAKVFELGIRFLSKPCCKVLNTTGQCIPGQTPCPLRALHFFYDNFHPTEIINKVAATAAYAHILRMIS